MPVPALRTPPPLSLSYPFRLCFPVLPSRPRLTPVPATLSTSFSFLMLGISKKGTDPEDDPDYVDDKFCHKNRYRK